ncbi:MAG: 7-cyano-7-deazaguanine synthase [Acidobacteria bacterium]|nr:MAG: 7-cyano-7-deazaguanine synthase [Acidobacteriota bacterium]
MPSPNTAAESSGPQGAGIAALCSGGLDSAVMLVEFAKSYREVWPLYVRCGLPWEEQETRFLECFLGQIKNPAIRPVETLDLPMTDVYGQAWYASGVGVPGYDEADERWEIPGRNIILLSKAAVWCALHSVGAIGLGVLASNPFPDASVGFFKLMEESLSTGLGHPLRVLRPFAELHKPDVVFLGRRLPLHLTLSCASPTAGKHCGRCGKCRERIEAFAAAGVEDRTEYARTTTDGKSRGKGTKA